jgi:signal transduction histidine kinase
MGELKASSGAARRCSAASKSLEVGALVWEQWSEAVSFNAVLEGHLEVAGMRPGAGGCFMKTPTGIPTMHALLGSLPARALRAHEFKNCLQVIKAVNKLVQPELSKTSRQRMARSHAAVARMLGLISQDLVVEGGEAAAVSAFISANDVVRAAIARVEDVAEAGRVELVVHAGPGGVAGDAASLAEPLGNIVLNAIQSTSPGGTVFVATNERPDGSQRWMVTDTGPGMSEEVLARLETPYFSLRSGGWGLGLAAARAVVGRHGGLTHIESKPGSGTVVTIWLPYAPPPWGGGPLMAHPG